MSSQGNSAVSLDLTMKRRKVVQGNYHRKEQLHPKAMQSIEDKATTNDINISSKAYRSNSQ